MLLSSVRPIWVVQGYGWRLTEVLTGQVLGWLGAGRQTWSYGWTAGSG